MSDDLISRRAAEMALIEKGQHSRRYKWGEIWELNGLEIREVLDNLPSVQPEQKTGRWIYTNTIGGMRYYGCTICTNQEKDCIADENEIKWYNYCPNCGAKMEV